MIRKGKPGVVGRLENSLTWVVVMCVFISASFVTLLIDVLCSFLCMCFTILKMKLESKGQGLPNGILAQTRLVSPEGGRSSRQQLFFEDLIFKKDFKLILSDTSKAVS